MRPAFALPGAPVRLRRPRRAAVPPASITARSGGRREERTAAAYTPPPAPPPPAAASEPADAGSGWRTFWTAVDTSAWLGTVGTAVAFILTQEAMLAAAPVVLPLLALYASRQRERLAVAAQQQAQLRRLELLLLELQVETADEVAAEVGAEVQELLAQVQRQRAADGGASSAETAKLLRGVEAKLAAVEGSVVGTGAATREALQASAEQQGQVADSVMRRLQDLGTALRRDVYGALQAAGGEEQRSLARIEAQLAALEGAVGGLQAAQSEGLMRLSSGLQAAMLDAEGALQAAVREEAYRSLDPLRRLPELLKSAVPVTPEVLAPLDGSLPSLSEEGLRQVVGEALAGATRDILDQQAALLEELAGTPQAIAPQQWNQLGVRLASLQEQLHELAALQAAAAAPGAGGGGEGAAGEGSGAAAAAATAEVAAVAAELAGLRSELGSLTSSVQQLLEAQRLGGGGGAAASAGGSVGAAVGLPPGALAGVAAAVQAVQDQVVLLRQDLDGDDPRYASFVALEQQLEAALEAMFDFLRDAPPGAASAAAAVPAAAAGGGAASPAAAAALEQSLAALGARLDGMGQQLESLQAGMAAVAAAPTPSPAAGSAVDPAAQQQEEEQKERQEEGADAAADAGAEPAGQEGKEAAYRRMQLLLQQQSERRPDGEDAGAPASSGKAFAEWLSGHRENGALPAATASASSNGSAAALAAAPPGAAPGAAGPMPSGNGSGGGGGGVQGQIEFAAAVGLTVEEELIAVAAASYDAAFEDGQPASARWQGEEQAAAAEVPYTGAKAPNAAYSEQRQEQDAQQQDVQQQQWQQQLATPPPQAEEPAQQQQEAPPQATAEQLYERGVQRLREGRALAATPGADLGLADSALWEAADCFEQLLAQHDPANLRARGNYGNALLSHGRLKKQMLDALAASAPADQAQAAALAAAAQRLAGEALELLLLAGRQYKAVLEADPSQAKAFINWGRVVGLRADMARAAGDAAEAGRLFGLAADKFDAALDLEPQNVQALRLGGQAVLDAALCTLGSDLREARALLKDAGSYLEAALALDPQDGESVAALERCAAQLAALREQRQQA